MAQTGSYQSSSPQITAEATNLINQNASEISGRLGVNSSSYVVNSVFHQIANGKNYLVHISTHSGHKFTVKLHVGADGTVQIQDQHKGHSEI